MIEKASGYTSNGTDFHATLEEAQGAALFALFGQLENTTQQSIAEFVLKYREGIIEILQIKAKGRPRKNADTTKPRKAKLRTAPLPLPLVEKEGA